MRPVHAENTSKLLLAIVLLSASAGSSSQKDARTSVILSAKWLQFVNGVTKQTCVKTYSDGRYILEKAEGGFQRNVDSYDSVLSDTEIDGLFLIVTSKDFQMLQNTTDAAGPAIIGQDGQVVVVQVSHGNEAQRLVVSSDGNKALPMAMIPLLKWIKGIRPAKSSRIANGKPSLCFSVR